MKFQFAAWLGSISVVVIGPALADTALAPPVCKRVEHRQTWHGETVVDHYYWLREKSNPQVIDYLKSENSYTEAMTAGQKPLEETLYKEMLARIKQTDLSAPTRRGEYFYYSRTEEGKQYTIECRRKGHLQADEEVLLELNELARGHKFLGLGDFAVSDDGNLLAYTIDTTGFRQFVLHVKDLRTGKLLSDTAERVTSVEWAADNQTLYFTTEDPVDKRSNQLWRHALGETESELVHDETNELFDIGVGRTSDKKLLVLSIHCADSTEVRATSAGESRAEWRVLLAREPGHRYTVDHRDGLFYIVTNKGAKNFRIVAAPDGDVAREANWQEFVPHRPDVLVQSVKLFKDFAVVLERREGLNRIRTFDFAGKSWHDVDFPEPVYTASPSGNEEFDTAVCRYTYQSLVTPRSVYDYDMRTHQATLVKREEVLGGYDPARYASERLWATARDGTRVPLSIVYPRGLKRDGRSPLLLYGYGSYGAGIPATFASDRVSLLERGMAFAIAHVRGGNELGETWRDGGMLMNKKNTFNDFVDCAEFLVQQKWTSPDRLAIEGASAGGLLMGAVVNQRPDLFKAVHAGVPFVDVMNTMMDPTIPLTVPEYVVWGNPNEKAAFDYMRSYSPYDNLTQRAYPAMLVTTSLNDSQVMYWEPAKYVARLRTLKTDTNPLVLKTNMGAGHGGASGRYDRLHERAFEYAWLLNQVGITK